LFERPKGGGERAVLVHVDFSAEKDQEDIEEFRELAVSAGAEPVAEITGARRQPDPKYLIGTGKADEIRTSVEAEKADLVLVDHELSPAQERNLERLLKCRVLDRTGLILDIFAQRASSHEGRLQVELAQLKHISTRLVRGWTHLERQKGGIGLRGPGETQLETDRRLLGGRIKQLNKRLAKVRNQRGQGRKARKKAHIPTVSLVGYTNAGKSTLFNRLTESGVYAADQLFATLDPTLRRVNLPQGESVILADTVGFIRHLPHDLVAAFHSTLEETREANLLLHVIDASQENYRDNIGQVNSVLKEIGAEDVPQIQVFNKVDRMEGQQARIDRDDEGRIIRVWLSAQTGEGMALLQTALAEHFQANVVRQWLRIPAANGRLRAKLFTLGKVFQECMEENGDLLLDVRLDRRDLAALRKKEGVGDAVKDVNCCG
jgi:GTP-binding protein HflX